MGDSGRTILLDLGSMWVAVYASQSEIYIIEPHHIMVRCDTSSRLHWLNLLKNKKGKGQSTWKGSYSSQIVPNILQKPLY